MSQHQDSGLLPESGVGKRLRDAREAAGLSLADVSGKLKMPVRVVESLEAEDWSRIGAPVFLRGQIRSYAKLLGVAQDVRATGVMSAIAPPVLAPRTYTPPMQRFAEQAARRVVYILITAAIIVPVWMASRQYIKPATGQVTPLDAPAGTAPTSSLGSMQAQDRVPMVASLATLPSRAPALTLRFEGDSWVEIVGADGRVAESGLLRAGDERRYAAGEVQRIKLGNATAVRVEHEGRVQDLAPYLRANVARFTVSSDGSLAPFAE